MAAKTKQSSIRQNRGRLRFSFQAFETFPFAPVSEEKAIFFIGLSVFSQLQKMVLKGNLEAE